jgi:2'-5' RNA ligase
MAVYVDPAMHPFGRMIMCHMTADTTEELLAMADKIGVQRKWIQYAGHPYKEHFDIAKSKRALAVKHGAVELNSIREAAEHIARRKEAAKNRVA